MDWADILMKFIKPELLILVPILWFIGNSLKKSPLVNDWVIPFVLLILSISFAVPYVLLTSGYTGMSVWVGIMQGLAIAVVEGQAYQYFRQLTDKRS